MANIPIIGPLQMAWFWMKNRRRAKALSKWAEQNGLQFAVNGKHFDPPASPVSNAPDNSHYGRHSKRSHHIFERLFGMSKIQTSFPQFAANRFRGDWQSDKNICWGTIDGFTVITWDTVVYDLNGARDDDWTEGEYSSVLVLTDIPLHSTQVVPNSLWKRVSNFGIEEGSGVISYHKVEFELDAFNRAYRVKGRDRKWTYGIIDQAMMDWLMQNKKHTMEIQPGGVMISTWFTMTPQQIKEQIDFCRGFLQHIPEDLKHHTMDGAAV